MSYSPRLLRLVVAPLAILLLASCAVKSEPVGQASASPSQSVAPTYNSLSGRVGTDGPVLVVKIDDTTQAHPQIGLDDADVVYIEQVEGGLTRLAAIFSSVIPERIGPVRSARISDIDLLAQYGHVAFSYSGAQSKMLPVIAAANLENLGAQRESQEIYVRDSTRNAPVNLILKANLLMAKLLADGTSIEKSRNVGWAFGAKPAIGKIVTSVTMRWPANSYSATWSTEENRWLLFHSQEPDMAASGKQLGPTTLVIQKVSITPSIYKDKFGGVTPFSATIGSGTGYILRDDEVIPALWSRPSAAQGTTWSLVGGTPIAFAPGQIWVALVDNEPQFTFPIPRATTSPNQ